MGLRRSLQDFTSPVGNRSSAHCLFGQAVMMHCSWVHYVHWSPHKGAWLGAAASPLSSVLMDALKEYSSLQENPYNVRYIHTVLIVHIYFAPWGVDNV